MTQTHHMAWLSAVGAISLGAGAALVIGRHESLTSLSGIEFVLVAAGASLLLGAGGLVRRDRLASHSTWNEDFDIERADERNRTIAALSKARGFDFTTVALPGVILVLAVLRAQMETIIVLFVVYIATLVVAVTTRAHVSKQM